MMPQTVSKQQRAAIKKAMKRGGQAQLAREFGVSRATISQWLKFGSCLSAEKAAAITRRAHELTLTGKQQKTRPI
jgi:DNA-binding transcriptional regulator YdaS (Cro superfamily)